MHKLSLVLITYNAGSQLTSCLASAHALADDIDIVVVDSGSNDDTVAIAERFSARVIHNEFIGFGPQKRLAVDLAKHDWVLCLDADEQLTPELVDAIRRELAAPTCSAYRIARRNRFLGRYLRHGEGYPDFNIRLFDRRHAHWSEDKVHEHVVAECATGVLQGDLLHDSAESLANYLAKQNRYTDIQAAAMQHAGTPPQPWKLLTSPLARFIRFYIFRSGWRDGAAGFAHIAIGCFFSFVKYAKVIELQRARPPNAAAHTSTGETS
ncbi:MAG TPA: glycosyltransferase family 2 protein [Rhodocyclaceae bacterium]|nr:glycosyltransferase family 2 protein [Rhodocyclaceae bacterium]